MSNLNSLAGFTGQLGRVFSANDECEESLVNVIDDHLIPRLLQSEHYASEMATQSSKEKRDSAFPEFIAFTEGCRDGDSLRANAIVDALIAQGVSDQSMFLDLITPAARHLGHLWDKDLCSFTDVTCGLAIMHQITYRLGYEYRDGPQGEGEKAHVMLCAAPGSMHLLGITIVADLFKREGASVVIDVSATEDELVRTGANEWFDVIGVSVAIEAQLINLKSLVTRLKQSSGNPDVKVILGGPIFTLVEATPELFGADAISNNPLEVLHTLKRYASK